MSSFKNEYWDYYEYCRNGDRKEYHDFYKSDYLILAYIVNDVLNKYEYENIFRDNKEILQRYNSKLIYYDEDDDIQNKSKIELKMEELSEFYMKYKLQIMMLTDKIKTVYWGEEFEKFIDFTKENEVVNMNQLFEFDFKKLYGTKGFNYVTVNKTINIFEEWINMSMNRFDIDSTEVTKKKENDINNLLEEFFF